MRERGAQVHLHFAHGDGWTPPSIQVRWAASDRLPEAPQHQHRMPHGVVTDRAQARKLAICIASSLHALGSAKKNSKHSMQVSKKPSTMNKPQGSWKLSTALPISETSVYV